MRRTKRAQSACKASKKMLLFVAFFWCFFLFGYLWFACCCFFFIKKAIIYWTSVLSSLICQNIGEKPNETCARKTMCSIVCFFSVFFLVEHFSRMFGEVQEVMTMNYMALELIKVAENCLAWTVLPCSRFLVVCEKGFILFVISILVATCHCNDPECWSINFRVNCRRST